MILNKVVEDPKQNRDDYFDAVIQYVVGNLDLDTTSKNQEVSVHGTASIMVPKKWPNSVSTPLVQKRAISVEEKRKTVEILKPKIRPCYNTKTNAKLYTFFFTVTPLSEFTYGDRIIVNVERVITAVVTMRNQYSISCVYVLICAIILHKYLQMIHHRCPICTEHTMLSVESGWRVRPR